MSVHVLQYTVIYYKKTLNTNMMFWYMKLFNFDFVCIKFSYNLIVTTECKLIRGWSTLD